MPLTTWPLLGAMCGAAGAVVSSKNCRTLGALVPQSPLHGSLGFLPLPPVFFAVLVGFVVVYLVSVDVAKYVFYRTAEPTTHRSLRRGPTHRVHRHAARWSHHRPLPRISERAARRPS